MKIAKNRNHPGRQAIIVLNIVSLFFLWPLWLVALCWALNGQGTIPPKGPVSRFLDYEPIHNAHERFVADGGILGVIGRYRTGGTPEQQRSRVLHTNIVCVVLAVCAAILCIEMVVNS